MRLARSALLLACCCAASAAAPTVFDAVATKDMASEDGPKFNVQLLTGALPSPPSPTSTTVVMTKKNGKKYRCHLPAANASAAAVATAAEPNSMPHVAGFLKALKGNCFVRLEGWWTYEFCFLASVRQFHQEAKVKDSKLGGVVTQEYTLGAFWAPPGHAESGGKPDQKWTDKQLAAWTAGFSGELNEDPKTRRKYWTHTFGNGTRCDVTGQPREAEVRLLCNPSEPNYLVSVEEVATCRYLVQFSSSLLCKHPAFAADEKKESTQNIRCEPLGPDGKPIPAPTRVEKLAAAEKAAAAAAAAKKDADDTSADDTSADADADAAGADAPRRAPSSLAAQFAEPRPTELAFDLGQCLVHHRYNYRGTIVGYDRSCQQSEGWIRSMGVDALKYGRNQPFYHVLVDVRDRPGAQITYVAQENVMLDTPSVKLHLPMADDMFESFDVAEGRYVPKPELRQQYPLAERPAPRGSAGGE